MLRAKPDLMPETAPSLRKRITVCRHEMRPLAAGALYWEAEDTLLVADLHLEKGAAFAALGMLLPPCLPLIGFLYTAMTISSARRHHAGQGGEWKGRTIQAGQLASRQ